MNNNVIIVASVSIKKDGKVLLIKERLESGEDRWNFPSGRMEYGEEISAIACREVKEEVGLDVHLCGTTGVYKFISTSSDQIILFHYIGELTGGTILLEENVIMYGWYKIADLLKWEDKEFREPIVIKKILKNLDNNHIFSVSIFN